MSLKVPLSKDLFLFHPVDIIPNIMLMRIAILFANFPCRYCARSLSQMFNELSGKSQPGNAIATNSTCLCESCNGSCPLRACNFQPNTSLEGELTAVGHSQDDSIGHVDWQRLHKQSHKRTQTLLLYFLGHIPEKPQLREALEIALHSRAFSNWSERTNS